MTHKTFMWHILIQWLAEKNILTRYINELGHQRENTIMSSSIFPDDYITIMPNWHNSPEGDEYWWGISKEWEAYCKMYENDIGRKLINHALNM